MIQRIVLTFCYKRRKTAKEGYYLLEVALGNWACRRSTASEWHKLLKCGRKLWEEDCHSVRPLTSLVEGKINAVLALVHSDQQLIVREMTVNVGLPDRSVFQSYHSKYGHGTCLRKIRSTAPHVLGGGGVNRRKIFEDLQQAEASHKLIKWIMMGNVTDGIADTRVLRQRSQKPRLWVQFQRTRCWVPIRNVK
jgi:hypothetical protein